MFIAMNILTSLMNLQTEMLKFFFFSVSGSFLIKYLMW